MLLADGPRHWGQFSAKAAAKKNRRSAGIAADLISEKDTLAGLAVSARVISGRTRQFLFCREHRASFRRARARSTIACRAVAPWQESCSRRGTGSPGRALHLRQG